MELLVPNYYVPHGTYSKLSRGTSKIISFILKIVKEESKKCIL